MTYAIDSCNTIGKKITSIRNHSTISFGMIKTAPAIKSDFFPKHYIPISHNQPYYKSNNYTILPRALPALYFHLKNGSIFQNISTQYCLWHFKWACKHRWSFFFLLFIYVCFILVSLRIHSLGYCEL